MASGRRITNKEEKKFKFICIDRDGCAYVGTTPEEAFEKFEEDSSYSGIDEVKFFELGKQYSGVERIELTPVKESVVINVN